MDHQLLPRSERERERGRKERRGWNRTPPHPFPLPRRGGEQDTFERERKKTGDARVMILLKKNKYRYFQEHLLKN